MSRLIIAADQNMRAVAQLFEKLGEVRLVEGRALAAADLFDVDVLLVRSVTRVNRDLIHGSPVRFIGTATSGFDHVDREYLASQDIGFAHAPGSNANSVVEYVFAAIAQSQDFLERLLAGEPIGIVGWGNIGRALTARCDALGISYRIFDPWLMPQETPFVSDLTAVMACPVVSLHAALTREQPWPSYHLVGERELTALSPDTLLINASRGEVVSNEALLEALKSGNGPQCVLDVWESEPAIDVRLLQQVSLATAHIAGYSLDGKVLATRLLRDAVVEFFDLNVPEESVSVLPALTASPVPAKLYGADLLRWALCLHYDICADDKALRAVNERDLASGFDQLRKTYRDRRELAGSTMQVDGKTVEQAQLLAALGCHVIERGKDR